ncbi:hypothetical protein CDFC105_53659 [Clostridioides difficile]|nr:hypothetical protein [Clostridioides difficile]CZR82730.1 hypothetical protein CDFC105_53659 [Clostridioides difficile]
MCIRDRIVFILFPLVSLLKNAFMDTSGNFIGISNFSKYVENPSLIACLLYTSDAADEEDSVDLAGRRHT